MAGWSVTIVRQPVEDYPRNLDREKVLANWHVGFDGVRWISELVNRGEARRVSDSGYPSLYTAPACVIAPLFDGDMPPYTGQGGMFGPNQTSINRAALDACPADELLTIAVWDQS